MVMPNECVDGQRIPRPFKDEYGSYADILLQIKAYAKEIGFAVFNVVGE